ncbi:MAG: alpha/beta fold hydrolase, partial [Steroidobacteraceae bacterium]|nr:alpha/beta fold hydrolase [Steroidobacteraceae bacterium]MDW8260608.1 alpha/beta fold hydrolase [Gammaproteobacteria bacterium]
MAKDVITRHFASIADGRWGARQVHYRHVGSGPLVVMFHQSPLSSRDLIATMQSWRERFTCIAPDTPGYGLSDPLGVPYAEMHDFAEAVIEFFDALGIDRAAVYGFHTGAMIAAAVAHRYPERVVCAAANGYVVQTDPERNDFVANYLPPFEPRWDGSHLAWLWARMREQTIFFPWYRKTLAARLDFDVPPPEALHSGLLDFLRAGDHYRVGYRAAFTMRSADVAAELRVPALITASRLDVLAQDLQRIRRHPPNVTIELGGDFADTWASCARFIARHRPRKAPPPRATAPLPGRLWSEFVDVPGGQVRVRRNADASGRPVVVLHDAAGSADLVAPLAQGFIGRRPVIAPDLPGNGESDHILKNGTITLTGYAKVLLKALDALGVREFDCIGTWGGAFVGLEAALLAPRRLHRLVLADVIYYPEKFRAELRRHYTPDIRPNWHGGYLLEAWHMLRDQGLFWPWYARHKANIIRKPPYLEPAMVQQRVLDL